ncbi:hypothetical protein VZ94_14375 [Methylocucumis oryzae]|uniref:Uncharacterized protein n=1 Tax=Methylocucumis oryzae TaxID=1632867 RepID=A0A0F3IK67_9GAMM|nr:hypothetical protein VZ94_14375 [Methylocucumis oryzae]
MNLHTLKSLATSTCLALGLFIANSAHAAVPTVEYIGKAAITNCPTALNSSLVFHSDKIIFMIGEGVFTTSGDHRFCSVGSVTAFS